MTLSKAELNRYSQQLKLGEIGLEGQLKLKKTRVLCVGAGGLGSSLLLYLAAAGIGKVGIIDDDNIEMSNLHRQILYQQSQVGNKKAVIARQSLSALNPDIEIQVYTERFTPANANELINEYDIIADCTDNFRTHYLINDRCFYLDKPYVFASVTRFEGQCALFEAKKTPCFRCLFPTPSVTPDCSTAGVLGVVPGLLGIIQATEIIKWILKLGTALNAKLLTIDLLKIQFREFKLTQNPECALCVLNQATELPETNAENICPISVMQLQQTIRADKNIMLIDVRSVQEHEIFNLGGLLIPLQELPSRLTDLDKHKKIIVYCKSGERSMQAAKILTESNFQFVRFLEGGIKAWQQYSRF